MFLFGESEMTKVSVEGVEYELDDLSADAKAHFESIVVCDRKLAELQVEAAILQTAKRAYLTTLKELLPSKSVN